MHNYLDGSSGRPHQYDDSCIYRTFQAKSANDELRENFYKSFCREPIDETTYQQFYLFLSFKANEFNTSVHWLALLLREKQMLDFIYHGDIIQFLAASFTTFKYNFADLVNKLEVDEVLAPEEFNGLKTICETYFAKFIAEVQRREQ